MGPMQFADKSCQALNRGAKLPIPPDASDEVRE